MTNGPDFDAVARRNQRTGLVIMAVVMGMVGLSFASVPLYRVFCQMTGWGGPAQALAAAPASHQIRDRKIEVRFNADVDAGLPWRFYPTDRQVDLQVGQEGLTAFVAVNDSNQAIVGTAVFNVLPEKAGKYFHKVQCFCFGEQTLAAGQKANMPVLFYVDPGFADDPNMRDVTTLTLSYIFYKTASPALDRAMETLGR